jgi:phytoene dehydrogenase-like protein
LAFAHPASPLAHPLDDGTAVVVERSVQSTADALPRADAKRYRTLLEPFVDHADDLMEALLGPLGMRHPLLLTRFGVHAIQSAQGLANRLFESERTRAMFAGVAAHSMVPLEYLSTAGYALGLLIGAHAFGWPVAVGGSQQLGNAMASYLRSLGGEIITGAEITSLDELPPSRVVLCDVTPRQFLKMAGARMPRLSGWRLSRYRYGPGVFKMDWALNDVVPWHATECHSAGTIHLGGSSEEIAFAEHETWNGRVAERPYVITVQPSRFDSTRAPSGKHTLWAYCHVPNGSTVDMRERIESEIERAAPGFRDCIASSHMMFPADMERRNANLIGGDIAGGAGDLAQFLARPVASLHPYATAIPGVYLCSSSTPPGVGVHGMCGHYAARSALSRTLKG